MTRQRPRGRGRPGLLACRRCGSCRSQAGHGPTRFRWSPAARLVDHPFEQTAHRDTEARRLGLDPGAPIVVEADADNGGLGGRHGPVNSNPGCLHQRRRMVATRWWAPRRGSLPDWLRPASSADRGHGAASPEAGLPVGRSNEFVPLDAGTNPDAGRRPRGGEMVAHPSPRHPCGHELSACNTRRAPLTFIRDLVADSRRCRRGTRRSVGGTSLIIGVLTLPAGC